VGGCGDDDSQGNIKAIAGRMWIWHFLDLGPAGSTDSSG